MKLVMIAAGGTGGHIYPALAFAQRLKEEGTEAIFVGSQDRLEGQLIPEAGYRFIPLNIPNTSGSISGKIRYLLSMAGAIGECEKLLRSYHPDACVGFGNYISVPLILAAKKCRIPTMISEQNSFAGKANVFLGRFADAVELAYERSGKDFPAGKIRVLGNPQEEVCAGITADRSLLGNYGIDAARPFVLVMMGSLGSQTLSRIIDDSCKGVTDYQVLIAAGKRNPFSFSTDNPNVIVRDYVEGAKLLRLCDLAVCRAGATTLAELAAAGTPSILIPSPFVPNNHQYYNALELKERGAAVLLEETDLKAETLLAEMNRLMHDNTARQKMSEAAGTLARPHAASDMTEWLKEICDE